MENNKVVYKTKAIYNRKEDWKIKLEVIKETLDMKFENQNARDTYINNKTNELIKAEETTYKRKIKDFYKKDKKVVVKK